MDSAAMANTAATTKGMPRAGVCVSCMAGAPWKRDLADRTLRGRAMGLHTGRSTDEYVDRILAPKAFRDTPPNGDTIRGRGLQAKIRSIRLKAYETYMLQPPPEWCVAGTCPTNPDLLGRLHARQEDPAAWREFVSLYALPLHRWCRSHGLSTDDADDVAQEVLVRFWRQSKRYRHDPERRFRTHLRSIVLDVVSEWQAKTGAADEDAVGELLASLPAREDLVASLEAAYDTDAAARALREVERRVQPHTWRAFQLQVLDGKRGEAVARELGVSVNVVYVARHKVTRMLREAVSKLVAPRDR